MVDNENPDLLNVAEVATLLRLKPSTIRAWLLSRRLAHFKVGRRVFVNRKDAIDLLEQSRVPAIQRLPKSRQSGDVA